MNRGTHVSRSARYVAAAGLAAALAASTCSPASADAEPVPDPGPAGQTSVRNLDNLNHLKQRLDDMAAQGQAGSAQYWYVDPVARKVTVAVLRSATDAMTTSFVATATSDRALSQVTKVDKGVQPFVGRPSTTTGTTSAAPAPARPEAAATLYAGSRITSASTGASCTSAFTRSEPDGSTTVLTAGHCRQQGVSWNAGSARLGNVTSYRYPGSDWSRITAASGWNLPNAVSTPGGIQSISRLSAPTRGERICKQGAFSGNTCGEVTALNVTVNYGDGPVYGLAKTTTYAQPGDSGSPVYDASTGVGLVSGGPAGGGAAFIQPLG